MKNTPASGGYAAYTYEHDPDRHEIMLRLTGSGASASVHVLLPTGAMRIVSVQMDRKTIPFSESALDLSRSAQLRWDFVSSENSTGFHSQQEAARIIAVSVDLARQAQMEAVKNR